MNDLRNELKGEVIHIRRGQTTADVQIEVGNGIVIRSTIADETVDNLGLRVGEMAIAIIKSADVTVAKWKRD